MDGGGAREITTKFCRRTKRRVIYSILKNQKEESKSREEWPRGTVGRAETQSA